MIPFSPLKSGHADKTPLPRRIFYRAAKYEHGTAKIYFSAIISLLLLLIAATLNLLLLERYSHGIFHNLKQSLWLIKHQRGHLQTSQYWVSSLQSNCSRKKTISKQITRKSGHLNHLYCLYHLYHLYHMYRLYQLYHRNISPNNFLIYQ